MTLNIDDLKRVGKLYWIFRHWKELTNWLNALDA
jgi:hypothetical protein